MDIIIAPFAWILNAIAGIVKNYGLAVILFSLIIKLILLPFDMKGKKSSMRMSQFTPKIKELEKKYEGDKVKYQQEVAKLYKEENIKPLGGCLWPLIPWPIMIGLYTAIRQPFTKLMNLTELQYTYFIETICVKLGLVIENANPTYGQILYAQKVHENFGTVTDYMAQNSQEITQAVGMFSVSNMNFSFLGLNLAETPNFRFFLDAQSWAPADIWPQLGLFLIPIVSAALSYLSAQVSQKTMGQEQAAAAAGSMKGMMLAAPLISLWIGFAMPAVMGIYWIAGSVFSTIQNVIITRYYSKKLAVEQAEREERFRLREAELEEKRRETELLRAQNATVKNPNTSKRKIQKQEKAKDEQKAAEWNQQNSDTPTGSNENPSRVGDRKFARGRAYVPDRFDAGYQPVQDADTDESDTVELTTELTTNETLLPDATTGDGILEIKDETKMTEISDLTEPVE